MLQLLDLLQQPPVAGEELVRGLPVALDQGVAQEQLAGHPGVDPGVVDLPVGHDRDPVQGDPLGGHDRPPRPRPVGLGVAPLDQVAGQGLGPLGLDPGRLPPPQPRGLDQLGGHHPLRRLPGQGRAGEDGEPGPPRPQVLAGVALLEPDVAEQPGQQGGVDAVGVGLVLGRVAPDAEVAGHRPELAVQVLPLAHPQVVEELRLAPLAELVRGQLGLAFVQVAPEVEPGQEVGALVGEAAVELVGPLLLVGRALARVLDGQGGHDHQHLAGAAEPARLQQHPGQPRVGRDLGQLAPHRGQAPAVQGAQLPEEVDPGLDAARVGRVDEGEPGDVAQPQRGHLEDHRGQVGAQDLRLGELGPGLEVVLAVEPDADAVGGAPAAALALVGRGLRHRLDGQALHLGPVAVARDPSRARVDHVLDPGHGQRGLGHVGGQHHPPPGVGLEHAVLLARGQPRVQRQHLDPARAAGEAVPAQGLGGVADLPLPAEEDQDVPRPLAAQLVDRVQDPLGLVAVVVGVVAQRPVADLDRVGAPGHLDHRRPAEMPAEALRVDGRRGDDQLEVRPPGQQPGQVPEQEVHVEAALVGLVENDRVVAPQRPVPLQLGQQDPVGHQLDLGRLPDPVGEPDLVPDRLPQRAPQLRRHPLGHRPGRQPPRLGVPDHPGRPPPQLQADLRQLGRLPRPRLPRHHHDLMVPDRLGDLRPPLTDRQLRRIGDRDGSHTTHDRVCPPVVPSG